MATPTSAAIIAASRDSDLLARLVALASTLGISQADVEAARIKLAAAPVDGSGATIASVYEYAAAQPRYRAGEDPAGVTDAHILYALATIAPQEIAP